MFVPLNCMGSMAAAVQPNGLEANSIALPRSRNDSQIHSRQRFWPGAIRLKCRKSRRKSRRKSFRDGHLGNMLKGHVQTARNYKLKTLPKILPSFGRAIELASRALEQLGHMMKCRNSSTREIHLRILPKIHLNMKLGRAIELASRVL